MTAPFNEARLWDAIKSRSRVFDLETAGLSATEHPVIQGGVFSFRSPLGKVKETVFKPGLRQGGRWRPLSWPEFKEMVSPWAQKQFEGPWAEIGRQIQQGQGELPAAWFKANISDPVAQGDWLWAHNARFDAKFLAANLESPDYQSLVTGLGQHLSPNSAAAGRLHVTAGQETFLATKAAQTERFQAPEHFTKSWWHFRQTLTETAQNPRQGLILDSQYLVQTALAFAQEKGVITRSNDVFTGTSVAAYRAAFNLKSEGAHTAGADILDLVGRAQKPGLMQRYLGIIGKLRTGETLGAEEQRALEFHSRLQPMLFPVNAEKAYLKAQENLLSQKPFEYYNLSGQQHYSFNLQDLHENYQARQQLFGYKADLNPIYKRVSNLGLGDVQQELLFWGAKEESLLGQAQVVTGMFKPAWQRSTANLGELLPFQNTISLVKRNPFTSIMAGLGLGILGLGMIPSKDDNYNTIEGLDHGWFGQQRKDNTDFGSGYQDDETSKSWLGWAKWLKHNSHWFMGAAAVAPLFLAPFKPQLTKNIYNWYWDKIKTSAHDVKKNIKSYWPFLAGGLAFGGLMEWHNHEEVNWWKLRQAAPLIAFDLVDDILWNKTAAGIGRAFEWGPLKSLGEKPWLQTIGRGLQHTAFGSLMFLTGATLGEAGAMGLKTSGGFSGKDDNYNTIEGLSHSWGKLERGLHTDFGSGYKGDETSQNWLNWATALAAVGVVGYSLFNRKFGREVLNDIKQGIVGHPYVTTGGLAAGLGWELSKDEDHSYGLAAGVGMITWEAVDEPIYIGAGKLADRWLRKTEVGERWLSKPVTEGIFKKAKSGLQYTGAGTMGFAVGQILATPVKYFKNKYKQSRRDEAAKHTGLVQHLDRQKINHYKMNGY